MLTREERWLPVVGWEGLYEVSDQGRIRTVPRTVRCTNQHGGNHTRHISARIRKLGVTRDGYTQIVFGGASTPPPGQCKSRVIHQVVLEAFVGPRPPGMEACHNDGDKSNNALSNLRWDTKKANEFDAVRHGARPDPNRTHCRRGHDLAVNRFFNHRGYQCCRECTRINMRKYDAKRRPRKKKVE